MKMIFMKKFYWILLLASTGFAGMAQQGMMKTDSYCGTVELNSVQRAFLKQFQASGARQPGDTRAIIYLPLQIHIVGTDNGTGYYRTEDLFNVICALNEQFRDANIYWYIKGNIHYINNSAFYAHDFQTGAQMMAQNNVPGRVNVYFVSDPAGNCGYYSPYQDAVAIAKSCAGPGSTTLAHELGHYLSMPHTFAGWEQGTPPPADQERADGSNCQTAGDGFCDTPADYLAYRWNCPYSGPALIDPVGDTVHPDETLYMSYSSDHCQTRFSNQQISAMRQYIMQVHQDLLGSNPLAFTALDTAQLAIPAYSDTVPANKVHFAWKAVPGATSYHLISSRFSTFAIPVADLIVQDTTLTIGGFQEGLTYRWKVKPLMATNTCAAYSEVWRFTTGAPTGISGPGEWPAILLVYPNPVTNSESLTVAWAVPEPLEGQISLYDATGRTVLRVPVHSVSGNGQLNLDIQEMPRGIYLLQLQTATGTANRKVVISQ